MHRVIFFSKAKEKLGHWMSNILEKFLISRDVWKSFETLIKSERSILLSDIVVSNFGTRKPKRWCIMNVKCTQYGFLATQKQVENKKIYLT